MHLLAEPVQEAIEVAAQAGDNMITSGGLHTRAVSSERRVEISRQIIERFLEALPNDGLSVREILEAMPEPRP